MTPPAPDCIDRIESSIEQIVTKLDQLDAIAADITELGLEAKTFQARTDEHFNRIDQRFDAVDQRFDALDQRFGPLENRVAAQDRRLWTFVTALILALVGLLAKPAFFPKG